MQSSTENLHYVFDIGDRPSAVTCLPIAAESFKWKSASIFQMDGRKAKLSQFIFTELFFNNAVDLVLSCKITNMLTFGFEAKSFAKKNIR